MYIITNPSRKRPVTKESEADAILAAQKTANSTRTASTIEYVSCEGRRELWMTVRPEERTRAVADRIRDRMKALIDSGMTIEQAARTITAENMANFTR